MHGYNVLTSSRNCHVEKDGGADARSMRQVTKAEVLHRLASVTVPSDLALALEEHVGLQELRSTLVVESCLDEQPAFLYGLAGELPSIFPEHLHDWPMWYVKLPTTWAADLAAVVSCERFNVYNADDPLRPWESAQWLTLELPGRAANDMGRHIRLRSWEVRHSLATAKAEITGVIVLLECAGRLVLTAYPIDEALMFDLSIHSSAFSNRPIFNDFSTTPKARLRSLLEGAAPVEEEGVLTLSPNFGITPL